MRRLWIIVALLVWAASAFAQFGSHDVLYVSVAPSGSCPAGSRIQQLVTGAGGTYTCQNISNLVGTWAAVSGGGGGSGTVTTVSVSSANGVSGTVANPTTTPAITLALGAITPSSVASTGAISGTTGTFSGAVTTNGSTNICGSSSPCLGMVGGSTAPTATSGDYFFFGSSTNTCEMLFNSTTNNGCIPVGPTSAPSAGVAAWTGTGFGIGSATAANIGTLFNIAQYAEIYSNGTSAAPLGIAAPATNGDWFTGYHITGSASSAPVNEELVASTTNSDGLTVTPTYSATGPTQRFEITGNYSGSLVSATALPAAQVSSGQLGSGVQNSASLNLTGTVASGTAAMGTGAISSGSCATVVTVSASGVATTDVVKAGFNGDPTAVTGYGASASGAVVTIYPYPTSGNVNFKVCNSTASSITPGALTLNWFVQR